MTSKFLAILIASFLFFSCNDDPVNPSIEGTWTITSSNGYTHDYNPNNPSWEQYSGWEFDGMMHIDTSSYQGNISVDTTYGIQQMIIDGTHLHFYDPGSDSITGSIDYVYDQQNQKLLVASGDLIFSVIELTESHLIIERSLVEDLGQGATTTHYQYYDMIK